ncbi:MAG: hypothetical protein HYX61_06025 [Gammaproteobacteria bacterium]|jgi:hypothetical protein|nr:hypothetical protein [Gammaproteobacteria bacterium]
MSLLGPQHNNLRLTVQSLLDAIAPDCVINTLERANNPQIQPEGWQDSFFDKKIREPLNLDVLELNSAWEDDTPPAYKLADILSYMENGTASKSFLESIAELLKHAPGYIQGIHQLVQSKFDDPKQLDCYEPKALVAFNRMVKVVLAFNALQLLATLNQEDLPQSKDQIQQTLHNAIVTLSAFSALERMMFRYHKAARTTLSLDAFKNAESSDYEQTLFVLKNLSMYPVSTTQAMQGWWQGSFGIIKGAIQYPFAKVKQLGRFMNQATAFPFRMLKATTQDIPVVGSLVGRAAETLNTIKDTALPFVGAGALSWLAMLELCRLCGLTPDLVDANMLTSFMVSSSPYLTAVFEVYVLAAGAVCTAKIAYVTTQGVKATARGIYQGKDLVQAIIDENNEIFNIQILTDENLANQGLSILNTPIIVPEDLKAILSQAEQEEIIARVVRDRLELCKPIFSDFQVGRIHVVRERDIARPVYLPSRGPHQQPAQEQLDQMLADLRLDDDALEELQNIEGVRTTFHQ